MSFEPAPRRRRAEVTGRKYAISSAASPEVDEWSPYMEYPGKAGSISREQAPSESVKPLGMLLEIKRVDEVQDPSTGAWYFRDTEELVARDGSRTMDAYVEYAFTVTRKLAPSSGVGLRRIQDIVTTIDIRSEYLRQVGQEVLKDAKNVSWTVKPLKIDPHVLLMYLPRLDRYLTQLRNNSAPSVHEQDTDIQNKVDHLAFLIGFLRTEYSSLLITISSLTANGEITFPLLWAILPPDTIVFSKDSITDEPRTYRLLWGERRSASNGRIYWHLACEYVEVYHDISPSEQRISFSEASLSIESFQGEAKISSLSAYPLHRHPNEAEVIAKLAARGRKWAALQGVHHMFYAGLAARSRELFKIRVQSRVMIDREMFTQMNANYGLTPVKRTSVGARSLESVELNLQRPESEDAEYTAVEDDLILSTPILYGFSLTDKQWLEFNVENVITFEWNDNAFKSLVLPQDHKTLVTDLVGSYASRESDFDDFIEGKGQGLVLNLYGPPGVGKSLTAEATSEYVHKPLYVVGAGDLGTTASSLDQALTRIFKASAAWKAVVLIDEADVFLEERSTSDLERNAMVAVFLRQLEYFRGIVFLTTNRVKAFDEAFQSRIHVSLRYEDLTVDAKQLICQAFLARDGVSKNVLTDKEIMLLAAKKINGRQIKNVVKTASALAQHRQQPLAFGHLMLVIDMMEHFNLAAVKKEENKMEENKNEEKKRVTEIADSVMPHLQTFLAVVTPILTIVAFNRLLRLL